MLILLSLILLASCSNSELYRVVHPDAQYSKSHLVRGDGLLSFPEYDLYLFPNPYGDKFSLQLEVRNHGAERLAYSINSVSLKSSLKVKYTLLETQVYDCRSGDRIIPEDKTILIEGNRCIRIWYAFNTGTEKHRELTFQDWGLLRPVSVKFKRSKKSYLK